VLFEADPRSGAGEMTGALEKPAVRALAQYWFALCRLYYRTRYRRLEIGEGVVITGRLRLVGRTRLSIGAHSVIRQSVRIDGGGRVTIGAHTRLNGDCWIGASTAVTIGDWCLISDCCIFDDDFHNVAPAQRHLPPRPEVSAPIDIGHNVWIGTRALVTKGVAIGDDSVVGAGAVVRADVPPGVIVIGNPASVVRTFADHELPQREWAR
jgi:acetyltransferase-like isoleucine patch superfamily enzyme